VGVVERSSHHQRRSGLQALEDWKNFSGAVRGYRIYTTGSRGVLSQPIGSDMQSGRRGRTATRGSVRPRRLDLDK